MKTITTAVLGAVWGLSLSAAAASAGPDPRTAKYEDVRAFLRGLVAKHPTTTELFELGVSDSGRMIEGVRIGSGPVSHLVVATHHGNEYGSTEVARAFAASLAASPIPNRVIYVIPVLNIYGYDTRRRGEDTPDSVYDSNRDYPGPCGTAGPFKLKSTALLAAFLEQRQIVAAATLHTFHPAVVYPWGFKTPDLTPPYVDLYTALAKAATVESGYRIGNSTDVLYPAAGTFEDYAFWRHGIWTLLFELGRTHKPYDDAIAEMIRVNVPGLRRMMEQAPVARAEDHEFRGRCDLRLFQLDRHDE